MATDKPEAKPEAKVKVIATTAVSYDGKVAQPDEEISVDAATAQQLVASGQARPSPTAESNEAGLPISARDQAARQAIEDSKPAKPEAKHESKPAHDEPASRTTLLKKP